MWGQGDQDGMWPWSPVVEMEWRAMRGSVWKVKRGQWGPIQEVEPPPLARLQDSVGEAGW